MRGTAVERSRNRQNKLDGIVAWYFDTVMESLPVMLQIALLLLGCALSRYLWEINITIASVVICVTSLGMTFYLFVVIAGTVSENCPYQTPGSRILRHILLPALRSVPSVISNSVPIRVLSVFFGEVSNWPGDVVQEFGSSFKKPWYSPRNILLLSCVLIVAIIVVPSGVFASAYILGMCGITSPLLLVIVLGLVTFRWYMRYLYRRLIALDLRCISWMLETSLDKAVQLSALKHLEPLISVPTHFNPALVIRCFNVFVSCVNVSNRRVVTMQGLEQLATVSALCFFHAISYLSVMDPTSSMLRDVTQHYTSVFPADIDFRDHQFSHAMNAVHRIFIRREPHHFKWSDYKPPSGEHTIVAHTLLKLARFTYQRMRLGGVLPPTSRPPSLRFLTLLPHPASQSLVPLWILNFALHSLSTYPLLPKPVIAHCLSIVAVDLDCDISDDKCVQISQMTVTLTLNQ